MKRCVLSLERKTGEEFEFRISGGSEFQSRGPMKENVLLPSDDLTYGMERTIESGQSNCFSNLTQIHVVLVSDLIGTSKLYGYFNVHAAGHEMCTVEN